MDKRIDEICRTPDIFVYLKKGFRLDLDFSQDGSVVQHCFGADDNKDIKEQMKTVVPCTCDWCIGKI
jgi:hypothetical protein